MHSFLRPPPAPAAPTGAGNVLQPPPYRPRLTKLRFGGYKADCPLSSCGKNTLQLAEVQVFDTQFGTNYISVSTKATADSTLTDGSGAHGPELVRDQSGTTWFGSGSSGASAWLQLDLGDYAPYYDQLKNISVSQRQGAGACPDMLRCYSLDLLSEKGQVRQLGAAGPPTKRLPAAAASLRQMPAAAAQHVRPPGVP